MNLLTVVVKIFGGNHLFTVAINCSWPGRWQCPTIRTTILDLGASPLPSLSLVTLCGVAIQRCFFLGMAAVSAGAAVAVAVTVAVEELCV